MKAEKLYSSAKYITTDVLIQSFFFQTLVNLGFYFQSFPAFTWAVFFLICGEGLILFSLMEGFLMQFCVHVQTTRIYIFLL